ncbi:tetratricopeptide repeat protein [Streptomyces phytophilus]|uniref:tetratricopeptide repeat protein n=1 Tax=Streptomyces phytophilus TaxID=722715 RepID=UPI0015F0214A|nr:tetratricopeptide repeat protein [Streptomyces phytophilus]
MADDFPAALPPHVLEREDVREALGRHDFGEVFRLAKKWGGISFLKISEACGIKGERVGQIARGRSKVTQFEKVAEIADGLRIPGHMLGLLPRPWEAEQLSPQLPASPGEFGPVLPDFDVGPWEVAKLAQQARATDVSQEDLETVLLAVDRLCRSYPYVPARTLHVQTRKGLRHINKMMNGRTTLKQHRELLVQAGWLFLLGGCLEYDMGQREAAEISRDTARRIGHESGHGEITAWSFELGAWFALTQGRFGDVLECVEAGHRSDSTHSVGVQLYAHAAKTHARIGNAREVRDTFDAGRARLDRLPRPDHREHHFVIDPDKWDFYEMDAYRMLGDDARASGHAREVIRIGTTPDGAERYPMRVAEARLTLGVAAARSGELDEAVSIARGAFGTERKSLPSLLLVAGELTGELLQRFPRESLTREFHEEVKDISHGAPPAIGPA